MKPLTIAVVALALVSGSAVLAVAQSAEPLLGTWKINLAKSTYSPGPKPTTAGNIKQEAAQGGFKTTIDGFNAQGKPTHTERSWKFDGKDYPVQGAAASNTTESYRRIDGHTFEITKKINGKVTTTNRVVTSADGKTGSATITGTNAQGQKVNNVIFMEKQ